MKLQNRFKRKALAFCRKRGWCLITRPNVDPFNWETVRWFDYRTALIGHKNQLEQADDIWGQTVYRIRWRRWNRMAELYLPDWQSWRALVSSGASIVDCAVPREFFNVLYPQPKGVREAFANMTRTRLARLHGIEYEDLL